MARAVPVGVLRANAMVGYFRSIAMAIEIQGNTKTQWKSYDESTALNIAYAMMPWKEKPGSVEVVQNWRSIEAATEARTSHLIQTFLNKMATSPTAAVSYAEQMQGLRQQALQSVQDTFRSVNSINAMVARQAADGARHLAEVQFGCTILLAATGCYLALGGAVPAVMATSSVGLKAAAVGLTYNIAGAIVKDSMSLKSASAIAIETSKTGTGEVLGHAVPNAQTKLAEQIATKSGQIRATEANIAKLNAELARKTSAQKIAKLSAQQAAKREGIRRAEADIAKATVRQGAVTVVAKGIPLLFLAHDIYNAVGDLNDVWDATR